MNALKPAQIEAVLARLGLSGWPPADLAGLKSIYGAWCRHVPFDNIRKLIAVRAGDPAPLPGDDPGEFLDAWLTQGVGGTCWAGNGALWALLDAMGFSARRGVATMMVAPDLPPNHGTAMVDLPEGRFVVDASILHVEPLPVREGEDSVIEHGAWGVHGHWAGEKFAIRWQALHVEAPIDCRIDEWPVSRERFRAQHEATRNWSPFNFELTVTTVRGETQIGVAHGRVVRLGADGGRTEMAFPDRVAFLVEELGIGEAIAVRIPADLPTPPPPGSRTAAGAAR